MTAARSLFTLFKDALLSWNRHKAPRLGAALAYYTVFSIAPLLLLLIGLAGLAFGEAAAQARLLAAMRSWLGPDEAAALRMLLDNAREARASLSATAIGVALLVFGALGVFVQLQDALNTIWDVQPAGGIRRAVRARVVSLLMVLGVGVLLLVSLVTNPSISGVGRMLGASTPGSRLLMGGLHLGTAFAGTTILFALLYRFLPDARVRWRDVWAGALVASLLFSAGRYLVTLYVDATAVSSVFGAAGSLAALLIWVYYSAQIILFGAELSRAVSLRRVEPA